MHVHSHFDTSHLDTPHLDTPHFDTPHLDTPHLDTPHLDTPHFDTPHFDTPHSVRFLRTIGQPETQTATWQHTTFRKKNILVPGGIRAHNPRRRVAADPRLRQSSHWDQPKSWINHMKSRGYDVYHQVKHKFSSIYPRIEVLCLICTKNSYSIR